MIVGKNNRARKETRNEKGQNNNKIEAGENQPFHVKRSRTEEQQLICGMRPVMEAIDAGVNIDKILIQSNIDGDLARELKNRVRDLGLPMQYVPLERLNRLTGSNHQGVVAMIAAVAYHDFMELLTQIQEEGRIPFVLMLDRVTDVRNLGAMVRTAECTGVDAVVVPAQGSARINEDAVKTSSGALLRVPLCREQNLKTTINFAKQSGIQVCAASEKSSVSYLDVDFTKPTLLIMGSEETGISQELLKMADVRAKLPIVGEVQSLNVSVAAAVFMYEMLRQRNG